MSMILSMCSSPSMRSCGAGASLGVVELARDRLVERVDQQGRLAAAGDAGDAGEQAERNFRGDVFQIMPARADQLEGAARIERAPLRDRHHLRAGEVLAGERMGRGHDVGGRALGDDVAAMHAGAGADVDHVVGGADRVLVMLDHDHGVAEVAQALERFQEPRIVALVQADRRLVQHIEHAGQPRADLRGEPDALALAAGQRAGGAGQREVVEADIDQELQPLADFLQHAHGDFVLLRRQALGQGGEPFAGAADREFGDFADMLAADLDAQRLRLEAIAVAGVARDVGEVFADLLARPFALGLLEAALEIGDHALERLGRGVGAQAVVVGELDLVLAGAVEDRLLRFLRQVLPFGGEREFVVLAERFQRLQVIGRSTTSPTARWRLSSSVASLSGMTRSASIFCSTPRPPQAGQAP